MPARPVLALTVLGVALDLECTGPQADTTYAALAGRWSLCARADASTAAARLEVVLGEPAGSATERRITGPDLDALLVACTQAVTRTAVEANAGRLLMFHAAGLSSLDTGASVVMVAPGGTGKTTACRTLGPDRGYVSDETVGVAAGDEIVPYPKPLSVRRPGLEVKDEVDPLAAGLQRPRATPYVAGVLLLDRSDTWSGAPETERLDPLHAITDLVPETSSLERLLPRPLHRLHDLLGRVDLLARVRYREAADLQPIVDGLIGS